MKKLILITTVIALTVTSCVPFSVIRPGQVGVKQSFGQLKGQPKSSGLVLYNPFVTQIVKLPTRTVNREVKLNLPSKEGLNVAASISILYHLKEDKALDIISTVGKRYESVLILSTFRSAAADVCARFYAKDMHSGKRAEIEEEIKTQMSELLKDRGFVIEAILLKSITLPSGLYAAIEGKLKAEQEAQQMEFVLQREKKEAERKRIEAEGERDAQNILREGITEGNIKWKSLEVLREISNSPNAKLIITDGSSPVLINGDE